jgi:hypothetical protein
MPQAVRPRPEDSAAGEAIIHCSSNHMLRDRHNDLATHACGFVV